MEGHITCVICPVGCKIAVRKEGIEYIIEGNRCKRGEEYARNELVMPRRILTTSVKVANGHLPLVSVKTSRPVDKAIIREKMNDIKKLVMEAPVYIGDIVLEDFDGEGTPLLATRSVEKADV
jgi:CxxC motif-containing protein